MAKMLFLLVSFAIFSIANADYILPSTDVNLINFNYYPNPSTAIPIIFNNTASLAASGIVPGIPTVLLIDGFLSNSTNSNMTKFQKDALFSIGYNGNIIIVDWGALSGGTSGFFYNTLTSPAALALYPIVVLNAPSVGQRVGDFLQFLNLHGGIPQSKVWMIGHSEGAHIAGVAGNQCKTQYGSTVSKITGQDPAGPLYFYLNATYSIAPAYQLVSSDATWVDVYHTGRGLTLLGISPQLGFGTVGTSVGNMDVFINGGNGQPGCLNQTSPLSMAYCDHIYSWQFYIDTMTSPSNTYGSCPCTTGALQGSTCLYNPGCLLSLCNLFKPPNCSVKSATGYNAVSGSTGTNYVYDTNAYPFYPVGGRV